mgnify:CR=1 FL=1
MQIERVLLIDDSDIDNLVNRKVIERAGHTSSLVIKKSALEAFDYLKLIAAAEPQSIPQLIFLDIRMPDIDGFGFLELFNDLPGLIKDQTRIVMLSSSIDSEDHNRAMQNPYVLHFFNKPLKKESVDMILTF